MTRRPNLALALAWMACVVLGVPGSGGTALAAGTDPSRGPYLQSGSDTGVTVRWRTLSPTDTRLVYGTSPGTLDTTVTDGTPVTDHEVTLTGLTPETRYYYGIGNAASIFAGGDAEHFFVTAPSPGTARPTRIWVLGDSGTGTANQAQVRDAYYNFTGSTPTDLWLMLGDNAYNAGTDSEYQTKLFEVYGFMLRKSVLWPTVGNHDAFSSDSGTGSGVGPYYDIFTLPTQAEAGGIGSGTEAYYAFDHGNIHFVVLESAELYNDPDMYTWLAADLASTAQDWIIAFWHHPPYTDGSHHQNETELLAMRLNAVPILEDVGVDLVLTGHNHSYERSFLLDSGVIADGGDGRVDGDGHYFKPGPGPGPVAHQGAVYVVAGSSGLTTGGPLDHPLMFHSAAELGSLVLDVDGFRLDARFLDDAGSVRDYFTLIKAGDCNLNDIHDADDIADGTSTDCDANLVPDECDLADGRLEDCNANGIADLCEVTGSAANDCNGNGVPDDCEDDCDSSGTPDDCDIAANSWLDCNVNGTPDTCDTASGTSADVDGDLVPDECQDCDGNGVVDSQDIAAGTLQDVEGDGVPDACRRVRNYSRGTDHATLQLALDHAADFEIILAGPGVYREAIDFAGKALALRSWAGAEATVIDANGVGTSAVTMGTFTDLRLPILDGFRITGGAGTLVQGDRFGGGVYADTYFPTVVNSIVEDNTADFGGGIFVTGPSGAVVINTVVRDNHATVDGGGLYLQDGTLLAEFATLHQNTAGGLGGAVFSMTSFSSVQNSIFWNNGADPIHLFQPGLQVGFSVVQGGFSGSGNLDSDPLFADPAAGDLRLAAGSPCIDAGTGAQLIDDFPDLDWDGNTVEPIPVDVERGSRPIDGNADRTPVVDIGAYELREPGPPPVGDEPGTLLRIGRVGTGTVLQFTWGEPCVSAGQKLVYGLLESVSSYDVAGALCSIGSPLVVNAAGAANLWLLVVSENSRFEEGSWGRSSFGERNGILASRTCSAGPKNLWSICP